MTQRPWMPLYIADYLLDTRDLTLEQHGAYLLLIMHYWTHGGLPTEPAEIRQILAINGWHHRRKWESICQAIAPKFGPNWTHNRIDQELEKANNISNKRAVAGLKGREAQRTYPQHRSAGRKSAIAWQTPHTTTTTKITTSLLGAAEPKMIINGKDAQATPELLEIVARQNQANGIEPAPASLATALPAGALTRPAVEERKPNNSKKPTELTKGELEAMFAAKRAPEVIKSTSELPIEDEVPF